VDHRGNRANGGSGVNGTKQETPIPKVDSAEKAKQLAEATGKSVEWEITVHDFETEQLIKKLMKKAKLKVIKT